MSHEISRDPSDYRPRDHVFDRANYRGIDLELVGKTISEGEVYPSHKSECRVFKRDYSFTDRPVRVVANVETGEVITVAWEYTDE